MQNNILLVDNDITTLQLMEQALPGYTLTLAKDALQAIQSVNENSYDLIIITIGKVGIDGYKIIEQIQSAAPNQKMPVIYLVCTADTTIQSDIDYCQIDSVSQPYGYKIFADKVKHVITHYQKKQQKKNELNEITEAMLSLQNDNAKLYDICRFLQRSFFCKDINDLCQQLFIVTRSFHINCTIHVHSEKNNFFISDGITHGEQINHDILTMVQDEDRIFQFGNNRAVFNWTCASLLVNKVGADVDNLALLMDGFEMGFKAIEGVDDFEQMLEKYRDQNYQLKVQVTRVIEDVASNITDKLSERGPTAMHHEK